MVRGGVVVVVGVVEVVSVVVPLGLVLSVGVVSVVVVWPPSEAGCIRVRGSKLLEVSGALGSVALVVLGVVVLSVVVLEGKVLNWAKANTGMNNDKPKM